MNQRPKASLQRAKREGAWAAAGCISRAHIMGVVVSDTTIDTRMADDNTTPNSRKNRPTMPPINNTGINTAIKERLIDTTVKPISRAPFNAASIGDRPLSMWRRMFSSTTMASSTTKPVATVSAINERLFRL